VTIEDILREAMAQVSLNLAPTTARTYANGAHNFKEYLISEKIKITDDASVLTVDLFIHYAVWLSQNGYKKKTVGVYLVSSKHIMDWLVISGLLSPTYQDTIRIDMTYRALRKKREDYLPRFPKRDEVDLMKEAANKLDYPRLKLGNLIKARNVALVYFLASTGCRNNEARSLCVGDLDFVERQTIVTGKGNKQRTVFFDQDTIDKLNEYFELRKWAALADPVFARHDYVACGNPNRHEKITTTSVRNIVNEVSKLAGIDKGKFTPHYFRHAFAINMLRNTKDLASVQDMMGHVSANSTRVYAKIYPDDLRETYRKVMG
jgi:site-specific recombinase XerD